MMTSTPRACARCGPRLMFEQADGDTVDDSDAALAKAVEAIRAGDSDMVVAGENILFDPRREPETGITSQTTGDLVDLNDGNTGCVGPHALRGSGPDGEPEPSAAVGADPDLLLYLEASGEG